MTFFVPGDPCGYTRMTRRGQWGSKAAQKYIAYKRTVQAYAMKAGLKLPLVATEESPLRIDAYCTFRNRRHVDVENARKGCIDALFYGGKGDRYVFGYHAAPRYVADVPGGEVGMVVVVGATEILR